MLIASSITGDSEKGDDLFFFEDHHFFTQRNTISDVIHGNIYSIFADKYKVKKNPRHTCKSSMAHSLEITGVEYELSAVSTKIDRPPHLGG